MSFLEICGEDEAKKILTEVLKEKHKKHSTYPSIYFDIISLYRGFWSKMAEIYGVTYSDIPKDSVLDLLDKLVDDDVAEKIPIFMAISKEHAYRLKFITIPIVLDDQNRPIEYPYKWENQL